MYSSSDPIRCLLDVYFFIPRNIPAICMNFSAIYERDAVFFSVPFLIFENFFVAIPLPIRWQIE